MQLIKMNYLFNSFKRNKNTWRMGLFKGIPEKAQLEAREIRAEYSI
jgi:hypothetical protein